jgi:predicted kinase
MKLFAKSSFGSFLFCYTTRMNSAEVLILHGSPGSGKSTLARALWKLLREAGHTNAVIDLDELNLVHPDQPRSFARSNLKAIWPNYAAIPGIKVVMPTVIADEEDYKALRDAAPAARFMVCELVAPKPVLVERVSSRETTEYGKDRLLHWVDVYHQRDAGQKFGDFEVTTHGQSIADTAQEIITKAAWGK